ncbi:cupredoxin domain-containing protein [Halomonas cerina]|uniref:Plastocyanin n=1 Tax=Halomonas cerina TaxID=447424 RepID=A0A839V2Y8_9GAMM|nr:cupredoxin domain-containing protein [Halomonas cerina]MBB3189521.1 plastocyanin [Halomonas cerina]
MSRLLTDISKQGMAIMLLALVTMIGSAAVTTAVAGQPETVRVTITAQQGFQFQPAEVEVPAGTKVVLEFENAGVMGHNLHIPELDVMTKTITAGGTDTVKFTVDEAGTYAFRCEVPGHAEAGMSGELKVL